VEFQGAAEHRRSLADAGQPEATAIARPLVRLGGEAAPIVGDDQLGCERAEVQLQSYCIIPEVRCK